MQRVLEELWRPTTKVQGKCTEEEYLMCPEGTSPQSHRRINKVKMATIVATAPIWGNAIGVGVAALVGCAVGPATLGISCAAGVGVGVTAALGIPIEWPMAAIVAPLLSIDIFPKCRCYPDVCKYDKKMDSCRMKHHDQHKGDTKNPYRWLPYVGQKCVALPGDKGKLPTCAVQACTDDDFSGALSAAEFYGTMGWKPGEENQPGAGHTGSSNHWEQHGR